MARTPVGSGATTLSRSIGFNGGGNSGTRSLVWSGLVVEGTAERIDHAAEQFRADADRHGALPGNHQITGADAGRFTERHGQERLAPEADDLDRQRRRVRSTAPRKYHRVGPVARTIR